MNSTTYDCELAELADEAWRPPPLGRTRNNQRVLVHFL
jgi:hypothetical protein